MLAACRLVAALPVAGTQPLSFQWIRNDREIPGATNAILSYPEVTIGTLGMYVCRISNAAGVVLSTPVEVALSQSPPVIEEGPAARIEVRQPPDTPSK